MEDRDREDMARNAALVAAAEAEAEIAAVRKALDETMEVLSASVSVLFEYQKDKPLPEMEKTVDVVITQHPGLIEVICELGLATPGTPVISHATAEDVRGKHVVGVLPLKLAALAASVTEVTMDLPPEARGRELSAEEVRLYMTSVKTYIVREA